MRCTSPRTAFWTHPRTLYAWIEFAWIMLVALETKKCGAVH
jgi:hypothetical protein